MNNKTLCDKLKNMIGKTYQYGNNIHYIIDCKIDDDKEKCVLRTNLMSFERPFENLEEFLKFWIPVSNLLTLQLETDQNTQVAIYIEQDKSLSNQLLDTLADNITKVQKDKNYIPQAKAINNNINSAVNILKMRLDFIKQMKTLHPGKVTNNHSKS